MEQGSRLDSRPASSAQDAPRHTVDNPAVDEAVARLLAEPQAPAADAAELPPVGLTPAEACPAFQIGAQIGRLVAYHYDLDTNDEPEVVKGERHREMNRAQDKMDLLAEAMTYNIATSMAGALAQIVVGIQFVNETMEREDLDAEQVRARLEKTRRCLFSVAGVLASQTGVSPRVFGSDYTLPTHLDHLRLAMAPVDWKRKIGPKPTIASGSTVVPFIEGEMVRLNEESDRWWRLYDRAGDLHAEFEYASRSGNRDALRSVKMADMSSSHATRIVRENLIAALSLPATTVRELGLQARLVSAELSEWWDNNDLPSGEMAARTLLARLMGLAGVARIPRKDLKPEEVEGWIKTPLAYPGYFPEDRGDRA